MLTKVLSKVVGLLLILAGLWWALAVLAFASMIDPSVRDGAWWAEFWNGIRGGWGGLVFGLMMATIGGRLVVPPGPADGPGPKPGKKVRDEEIG